MGLIVVGGIGFLTWDDIRTNGRHLHHYRMQSKVILATTAVLIVVPAVWFFFDEFSALPLGERVWMSLFQSVTPAPRASTPPTSPRSAALPWR